LSRERKKKRRRSPLRTSGCAARSPRFRRPDGRLPRRLGSVRYGVPFAVGGYGEFRVRPAAERFASMGSAVVVWACRPRLSKRNEEAPGLFPGALWQVFSPGPSQSSPPFLSKSRYPKRKKEKKRTTQQSSDFLLIHSNFLPMKSCHVVVFQEGNLGDEKN